MALDNKATRHACASEACCSCAIYLYNFPNTKFLSEKEKVEESVAVLLKDLTQN